MKTIICGSRNLTRVHYEIIKRELKKVPWKITEVISGTARGADTLGEIWARENGITVVRFKVDWSLGRAGGPKRNAEMVKYGEACVAFPMGESRGTYDCIRQFTKALGKDYLIINKM